MKIVRIRLFQQALTSPNGSDELVMGSTYDIEWEDNFGEDVKIELYKSNASSGFPFSFPYLTPVTTTIIEQTESDGLYQWTVPENLASGSDYKIRVRSAEDGTVFDESDRHFIITPKPEVTVLAPNSNDVALTPGKTLDIRWQDNISENVRIDLYKNGALARAIVVSTESDGQFTWEVPTSITSGTGYQIKVSSTENTSVFDQSDQRFRVNPLPEITIEEVEKISSINNFLDAGSSSKLTWDTNFSDAVKIELYKNGELERVLLEQTENDGEQVWQVPSDLEYSDNYQIRLSDLDGIASDLSNSFKIYEYESGLGKYLEHTKDIELGSSPSQIHHWVTFNNSDMYRFQVNEPSYFKFHLESLPLLDSKRGALSGSIFEDPDRQEGLFTAANPKYGEDEFGNQSGYIHEYSIAEWTERETSSGFSYPYTYDVEHFTIQGRIEPGSYLFGVYAGFFEGNLPTSEYVFNGVVEAIDSELDPEIIGGNNNLHVGSTYEVQWNKDLLSGPATIEFGGSADVIADRVNNSGSFLWTIPEELEGRTSHIRVAGSDSTDVNDLDSAVFDFTDSSFLIKEKKNISVGFNGNENLLTPGEIHTITWVDNFDENVRIDLYQAGSFKQSLSTSTESDGSFEWIIPEALEDTQDYQYRISSVDEADIYSFSASSFEIGPKPNINLVSISGIPWENNLLTAGRSYSIEWDANFSKEINLELYKAGIFERTLATISANDDNHTAILPSDLIYGEDYQIRVSSLDGIASDLSENLKIYAYDKGKYISSAVNIEIEPSGTQIHDWVSSPDLRDFFKFELEQPSYVKLHSETLSGIAGSYIYPHPGASYDEGSDWIPFSGEENGYENPIYEYRIDENNSTIQGRLEAGTYLVQVAAGSDLQDRYYTSEYKLEISAQEVESEFNPRILTSGTELHRGSPYTIAWDPGNFGDDVRIEHHYPGTILTFEGLIAESTPNDGLFTWTPPIDLPIDSQHVIRVSGLNNTDVTDFGSAAFDFSDDVFAITPEKSIIVNPANAQHQISAGLTHTITWEDNFTENVKIDLYRSGSYNRTIATSTASDGSFTWTVPEELVSENIFYHYRISSVSEPTVSALNSQGFKIQPKPFVKLLTPNGGEGITAGSTYNIQWEDNFSEDVVMALFKGDIYQSTLSYGTPSDGSYEWQLPDDIATGDDYRIRIASRNNYRIDDWSDDYFTIQPKPVEAIFDGMNFSGKEGDIGTLNVRLSKAISENVIIMFDSGNFITVDADTTIQNGTQELIEFTPQNWDQPRTFRFIAEKDNSSLDRAENFIRYELSGEINSQGIHTIGSVENTYSPDISKFNIELDYRNDYLEFWTEARREVAQQAADDWASWIEDELEGITLDNHSIEMVNTEGEEFYFTANSFIDDLTVFMGAYDTADGDGGHGGKRVGGNNTSSPLPRAGVVTVFTDTNALIKEEELDTPFKLDGKYFLGREALYSVVSHEIAHVLGLLGRNYYSKPFVNGAGTNRVFSGPNSLAANNFNALPMQPNDSAHVADEVASIMSYGRWEQEIWQPTSLDKAILADSGYRVAGMQYIGNP